MTTNTFTTEYDAIVVGARCAGSPTAMLLARQGHRGQGEDADGHGQALCVPRGCW